MRLVYSVEAIADLTRLRAFISQNDPTAAQRIGSELVRRIDGLKAFPYMGRSVDEAPDPESIRDMVFGAYVVRYALHNDVIAILRVWHHLERR